MPADLFEAYVAGRAGAFFEVALDDAAQRRAAVQRALRPLAPAVLAALRAQNERFGPSPARAAQLAALAEGAAVVVTGQQVGLFLGPLYTLYKTASAIRVARALAAESGRPVVPLFWLQSEDHDLPEVASCAIPRAQREPLALSVPIAADNRRSIAQLALPAEVEACHATLQSELGTLPHAREHLERLQRHYRAGAGWVEAFAGVLAELFEPEGLLFLNPRDPALARECAALHERALSSAPQLAEALLERCRALERAGFASMVHVRPNAPLSFYHPEGAGGPRYRLVPCDPAGAAGASAAIARSADESVERNGDEAQRPTAAAVGSGPHPHREAVSRRRGVRDEDVRGVAAASSESWFGRGVGDEGVRGGAAESGESWSGRGVGDEDARGGAAESGESWSGRAARAEDVGIGAAGIGESVFAEVGGSREHALPALLRALRNEPDCFSTSALLRPILQDLLLPTAAYVAGPGELAYFAQLQPLYAAFGLAMPLIVPRARFRLIESAARRLLERYGLETAAAALPEAELLDRMAPATPAGFGAGELEAQLRDGFERVLAEGLAQIGPLALQLGAAVAKTREKVQTSASKLAEKYASALARHDRARVDDARRLQNLLQPHGEPQERYYGLPYFAARYGERALIERVLDAIEPFAAAQKELVL